jgi:CheY-like chemotaxis protein
MARVRPVRPIRSSSLCQRPAKTKPHVIGLDRKQPLNSNAATRGAPIHMPQNSDTVVLVADDEPSTLALVVEHVRTKGYKVIEASDGDMAWQLAHQHLPDLVILDVMMPGMSGWEVCRKIREALPLAHTGVIMLTGIGQNLNEMTSPLYGADTHVDKPFEFSDLDEKIMQTLSERRQGAYGRADGADVETQGKGGKSEPAPPSWDGDDDAPMTAPTGGPLVSKVKRGAAAPRAAAKEAPDKPASSKPTSKKAPSAKGPAAPKKKAAKKAAAKKAAKKVAKKATAKKPALAKKATGKKASKKAAKKATAKPVKKSSKKAAKKKPAAKKKASKKKAGKKKSR